MKTNNGQASNGHLPTRAELEKAGIRIIVFVPLERTLPFSVFGNFWAIAQRGWAFMDLGYGRTDANRNRAARMLLDSDFSHIMMLDLDHQHPPDVVERHARWVLADPEKRVIGGLHFRRGEPYDPLAFVQTPDGTMHPILQWPVGLIPIHAMGHGSLLVHRSVFEQLEAPWWGYDYGRADENIYPSEDTYFCYCCREAGIGLWVDTTTTSPHLTDTAVDESIFRAWLARHAEPVQQEG